MAAFPGRDSPNGIPVRAEVPVLADAQAAGQLRKLLHQFRAEARLARAPLIAPHGDGLGSAGAKAKAAEPKPPDINIVIATAQSGSSSGSFRGGRLVGIHLCGSLQTVGVATDRQ